MHQGEKQSGISGKPGGSPNSFAQLAAEKEQEWLQLQDMHTKSLEVMLKEKDKILAEQQQKFHVLKEDFKYNLKLLAERDQELERLELTLDQHRARLQEREAQASELRIHIDELKTGRRQDESSIQDLQRHYQQRIREKQAEVEQYKATKDAELREERSELEAFRRDTQRRIQEVEEELEIQRREMVAGFDDASRRREKESRSKIDELSSTVLAHEMKVKLLSKELDLVRGASQETTAQLSQSDATLDDLRKRLRQKEWELGDLRGMKDARIAELESQLQHAHQAVERAGEEFQRKHQELDRLAREREAAVVSLKEAQAEAERKLREEIRGLEGDLEAREVEGRRLEWEHQDALKDKEMLVEKLREELKELKGQFDGQLARMSKDMVSKDLVIESLRSKDSKLRAELESRKEDIERYKQELVHAAEKEQSLERSKAQLELDWQRRYEDAERNQYSKSEDLIARLSKSRDDAVALNKELERELQQRDDLNRVLARDRDQAVATLRKHKLQIDRDIIPSRDTGPEDSALASDQIQALQAQNESLIAVIRDMKREMDELAGQADGGTTRERKDVKGPRGSEGQPGEHLSDKDKPPFTEEYVKSLEKECRELKVEKRRLEERLATLAQSMQDGGVWAASHHGGTAIKLSENDAIKSHIQSLNDTIGALRADKVTSAAELRKCQARLSHLEVELNQKQHQPSEKQMEIDQLRYELSTQARRHAAEASSLAQRIGQLELQLAEARREADEYHMGTLQTNLEATALGKQVSQLKVDLAGRGPVGSSHGTQNTLIAQLQREVHNLRAQLSRVKPSTGEQKDHSELRAKLKTAARHIGRLAKERQKLIEMGNRLRAELALHRPHPPSVPVKDPSPQGREQRGGGEGATTAGKQARDVTAKLDHLEKLQYALTKQELQFAHQRLGQDQGDVDVVQVQLSSSSDSTPEQTHRDHEGLPRGVVNQEFQSLYPVQGSNQAQTLRHSQSSEGDAPSSDSSANQRRTPLVMSSLGEESMQDVWRLLEDGASPAFFRSPSPMRRPDQSPIPEEPHPTIPSSHDSQAHSTSGLAVAGTGTRFQDRGSRPSQKQQLSAKAAGRLQPKLRPAKRRVRNYAYKDDDEDR
ncbi:coiled-coil domain-containing protein 57-like [Diadema setosum]|uniref:coiled-coil domain-containing protein 57-like n=1 Tax=Diadema setosum TaxID=31175 RepID=UPI003B3BC218